jgi:signal transduction histidine kinase/DNA-binding NarL/FixJ family response regulator
VNNTIRILLVEDNPADADFSLREIRKGEIKFVSSIVETESNYIKGIKEFLPDIILSDYSLPQFTGMKALKIRNKIVPEIPFIIITGSNNEGIAVECMKAGANDYILKNAISRLPFSIREAIEQKNIMMEKKRMEASLIESKEEIHAIYDNSPLLLLLLDNEGRIRKVNNFALRFSNSNEANLIGLRLGEALHCLNSTESPGGCGTGSHCKQCRLRNTGLKTIKSQKSIYNVEVSLPFLINNIRTEIYFLISTTNLKIQNNPMVIVSIMDITTLKNTETELIIAKVKAEESDKLKSAFLANMSHEIRTPMNGILGFTELLKDTEIDNFMKGKYIDVINKCGLQLLNIINDIIDISKIEAGQEKIHNVCFNLNNILDELNTFFQLDILKKELDIFFHKGLKDSSSYIIGDPVKLKQILTNLIGNALKFTHEGKIDVMYIIKDNFMVFSVKDTGIGILPSNQKKIFERFRQSDMSDTRIYGGTGLGLSISKSYTEMMGGNIYVESEFGNGSNFIVELPYVPAKLETEERKNIIPDKTFFIPDWSDKSILLAEDENFNVLVIIAILESTKVNIYVAKNGLEAVEMCKKQLDIDLVLMDIKMPVMDGLEATRIIKSIKKFLPVIAVTAYALSNDWDKCLDAGCDGYLPKPLVRNDLITIISKYFI